jgi:hypothetical protein
MEGEPTLAAVTPEDETQSLHAWSQEDTATELVDYRPRSWKIPALAATLAAISLTAGVFLAWPESAPQAQVAPASPQVSAPTITSSAPIQPQSPDQRFIALLKQRNVVVVSPPLAINGAHETCTNLAKGFTARDIAQAFMNVSPGKQDMTTAGTFVATAQEVYCPPAAS